MFLDKLHQVTNWTIHQAINDKFYQYALSFFILISIVLFLVRKFKQELIKVFSDEQGDVQITQNALHELARKSCETIPDIFSPTTTISRKGGKLRLLVRIRIKKDCDIKHVRRSLQQTVEQIMVKNLCFNNFDGCDILIKGFESTN